MKRQFEVVRLDVLRKWSHSGVIPVLQRGKKPDERFAASTWPFPIRWCTFCMERRGICQWVSRPTCEFLAKNNVCLFQPLYRLCRPHETDVISKIILYILKVKQYSLHPIPYQRCCHSGVILVLRRRKKKT
jgi:hypothetical protein